MQIKPPLIITSRLLPGVRIGDAEISIKYAHREGYRQYFRWLIDLPLPPARWGNQSDDNGEFQSDELSMSDGSTLQEGLKDLLGWLGAFADCDPDSEESKLFPSGLTDWAIENADEFSALECELQEGPGEFIVE